MKFAYDSNKNVVCIDDSKENEKYTCMSCGHEVLRKYGTSRQYFSHVINVNEDCEEKVSNMIKIINKELLPTELMETDLLKDIYSNYLNDMIPNIEGMTDEQLTFINSTEKRIK
jgi:competence CoiA-like predicted nuclease